MPSTPFFLVELDFVLRESDLYVQAKRLAHKRSLEEPKQSVY